MVHSFLLQPYTVTFCHWKVCASGKQSQKNPTKPLNRSHLKQETTIEMIETLRSTDISLKTKTKKSVCFVFKSEMKEGTVA